MTLIQSLLTIFLIIFLGLICQKRKMLNHGQIEGFEIFLFKVAMPAYLFSSTLKEDLTLLMDLQYTMSYLLTFALLAGLVMIIFYQTDKSSQLCLKILASGYVNAAIYTLPIITFLLQDPTAGVLGNLIQIIIIQSVFIIILNFIHHKEKSIVKKLWSIISMPLIFMPLLGLFCNYWQIELPVIMVNAAQNLGVGAPSLALFTFGLSLGTVSISKKDFDKSLIAILLLKNIIHPIIAFIVGYYIFNLPHYWLYSLLIAASAPTAFLVYIIAKQFAVEQELVKKVVALSSVFSLISLVIIAFTLR